MPLNDEQPLDEDPLLEAGLSGAFSPDTFPPVPRVTESEPVHIGDPKHQPSLPSASGRFQILGEVARGGMGTVLEVFDRDLGRSVAVKVLHERLRHDENARRRFLTEAQVTGQLHHPGIPPIHDLGRGPDGTPSIVMELIRGRTLADLLEERSSPTEDQPRLLRLFSDLCRIVAYAHGSGVVHRDIKPLNVMVGPYGEVSLLDWGVARILNNGEAQASTVDTPTSAQGTRAGTVVGTPGYMAPEQARGEVSRISPATDVFALGCMLCEILTGEPPVTGTTDDVRKKLAAGDLDEGLTRLRESDTDPELLAIAERALAPSPAHRYPDARALREALVSREEQLTQRAQAAERARIAAESRATAERRLRRFTIAGSLGVLVIAGIGLFVWNHIQDQEEENIAAWDNQLVLLQSVRWALPTPAWRTGTFEEKHRFPVSEFSTPVSGVGDVNGDGYNDVIVGAPGAAHGEVQAAGAAFVYSGKDGSRLLEVRGTETEEELGKAVADAGDVDQDGFDDVIFTAGVSALVYSGKDGTRLWEFTASGVPHTGRSVAAAGDVNGDGYGDIVFGDTGSSPNGIERAGSVSVWSGRDGTKLWEMTGTDPRGFLGCAVDGIGDINLDGAPDVIVGAYGETPGDIADAGSAYVLSGKDGVLIWHLEGTLWSQSLGRSVAGAGDVNGDRYVDVIVGGTGANSFAGSAVVYSGKDATELFSWFGQGYWDQMGLSVDGAGDVDADGYPDLLVGEPGAGVRDAGVAHVFSGKDGTELWRFSGTEGHKVGSSLGAMGDIDADGFADVIVSFGGNPQDLGGAFVAGFKPRPIREDPAFMKEYNALLEQAAASRPKDPQGHLDLATLLWNLDQRDEALEHYQVAAEESGNVEYALAYSSRLATAGRFEEAAAASRAITEEFPDNGRAWFTLGYSLHNQGNLDEALVAHKKAAELPGPSRNTAMYNAACAYAVNGDKDQAFEWLERSARAGFNQPELMARDTDMDTLREDPRYTKILEIVAGNR